MSNVTVLIAKHAKLTLEVMYWMCGFLAAGQEAL
jgi:hypothetical protein